MKENYYAKFQFVFSFCFQTWITVENKKGWNIFELKTPNNSIAQYFVKANTKGVMTVSIATYIIIILQVLV